MYTGTWADSIPTQRPLKIRPTMSMPMFWEAHMIVDPIILCTQDVSNIILPCFLFSLSVKQVYGLTKESNRP